MATTTSTETAPSHAGARIGRWRWVICALLFFATTINYIDRQVLGILAPELQLEIGWSELDYGRIVIAFQVSYAVMMMVWGGILDRVGTKVGLGLGLGRKLYDKRAAIARKDEEREAQRERRGREKDPG